MRKVKTLLIVCVVALSGCSGPKNLIHTAWVNVSTEKIDGETKNVNSYFYFDSADSVSMYTSIVVGSDVILKPLLTAQGVFNYENGDIVKKKSPVEIKVVDYNNQSVNYLGKFKNTKVLELQTPQDSTVTKYLRIKEKSSK